MVSLGSTLGFFTSGPSLDSSEDLTTFGFSLKKQINHKNLANNRNSKPNQKEKTKQVILHVMMLQSQVRKHVSVITIDIPAEHLNLPRGAKLIDVYHEVSGASS